MRTRDVEGFLTGEPRLGSTRRELIRQAATGSGLVVVSQMLPSGLLVGCSSTAGSSRGSDTLGQAAENIGAAAGRELERIAEDILGFIPRMAATALGELYDAAKSLLGGVEKIFSPGEVLPNKPPGWNGGGDDRVARSTVNSFRKAGGSSPTPLATPVVSNVRGQRRHLQLGADQAHFSLVVGHEQRAHWVHNSWLGWLLFKDNCDLIVDGPTSFEKCGVGNCRVHVSRQPLRTVDNRPVTLAFVVDPDWKAYAKKTRKGHEAHTEKWKGCPPVQPGHGGSELFICPSL